MVEIWQKSYKYSNESYTYSAPRMEHDSKRKSVMRLLSTSDTKHAETDRVEDRANDLARS